MHRSHTALAPLLIAAALVTGCGDSDTKLLSNARTRLEQKDVEGARLQLKTLLQKNPQSAEGRFLLGQLMVNSGDAAGGEAELRRALEGGHPEEAVLPLLATAMVQQGKGNLLNLQFGKTELKDDQAAGALKTQLAIALAQDGRRDDAEAMLAAALQRAPDQPAAKVMQAG
jgi:predicted Zn-dependent protease